MNAKDQMIHQYVTMADVQWQDGYKPRCLDCFVPCDPKSHAYRKSHRCEQCHDTQPIIVQPKEILPCSQN